MTPNKDAAQSALDQGLTADPPTEELRAVLGWRDDSTGDNLREMREYMREMSVPKCVDDAFYSAHQDRDDESDIFADMGGFTGGMPPEVTGD